MSLVERAILKEIKSWKPFGDALKPEDLELYEKMMRQCCQYLPSMQVKAEPFPDEALFMGLIFLQHQMIERLEREVERIERKEREKQKE